MSAWTLGQTDQTLVPSIVATLGEGLLCHVYLGTAQPWRRLARDVDVSLSVVITGYHPRPASSAN